MTTDSIILSSEEMAKYRQIFANVPDAIEALDVIEKECEGHLEDATILLMMRKTGKEPDRAINLNEIANQCRQVICQKRTDNLLELFNVVAPFLALNPATFSASLALPVVVYVVKVFGIQRFCENN